MIAIIDYGAGNLYSVKNALDFIGEESCITRDVTILEQADKLILPGVGAFPDAMYMLHAANLIAPIQKFAKEKPLLGICLGMQMLLETGYEFKETSGLGFIPGTVERMKPKDLVIPHIGWNVLNKNEDCPLLEGIHDGDYVYFVHSFGAVCDSKNVAAYTDYGMHIPAIVFKDTVFGCQFHPEKSGDVGLKILKNFACL